MKIKSYFISILLISLFCLETQAKSKEKPNIIFIMADDMAWSDVGYNGQKFYETPAIDKLSQKGMVFNRFYPGGPNCAPSRACILSGMYTPRTKIYTPSASSKGRLEYMRWNVPHREREGDEDLIDSREHLIADVTSIAEVLNTVGYYTASIGKWHVGNSDHQGFDYWSEDGRDKSYPSKYFRDTLVAEDMTACALKIMEEQKDNPFFIYFNMYEVHGPFHARKKHIDYYKRKWKNYGDKSFKYDPVYAAEMTVVDNCVRDIYAKLEELGLEDNTLVMFTSDNGGTHKTDNAPFKGFKGALYEGGIRTPMFAVWPDKIKPGTTCDVPVTGVDLLPTYADITGAKLPTNQPVDGISALPLLEGDKLKSRNIFWHYPLYLGDQHSKTFPVYGTEVNYWRAVPSTAVMQDDWKLIYFYDYDSYELYSLATDIGEKNNLIEDEPQKAKELMKALDQWVKDTNADVPTELNPEFSIEKLGEETK